MVLLQENPGAWWRLLKFCPLVSQNILRYLKQHMSKLPCLYRKIEGLTNDLPTMDYKHKLVKIKQYSMLKWGIYCRSGSWVGKKIAIDWLDWNHTFRV